MEHFLARALYDIRIWENFLACVLHNRLGLSWGSTRLRQLSWSYPTKLNIVFIIVFNIGLNIELDTGFNIGLYIGFTIGVNIGFNIGVQN